MRDDLRNTGYSKEDEYFFKKNQELVQKMREAANARKQAMEAQHRGKPYWMKCPKCGTGLKEETRNEVVRIDACPECGGLYFDRGELELLLRSHLDQNPK